MSLNLSIEDMSEEQILQYHAVLTILDKYVANNIKMNDPKIEYTYINEVYNCLTSDETLNKSIEELFSLGMDIEMRRQQNSFIDNETEINNLLTEIRERRKPLDKFYLNHVLLNAEQDPKAVNYFIEDIKEEDPSYYSEILATLLECFQEMPEKLGINKIANNKYSGTEKQINHLDTIQKCVNSFITDYEVVSHDNPYKIFALRRMDRFLFDGCMYKINLTKEDMKEVAPETSAECLQLMAQYFGDKNLPEYKNASALRQIFTNVMQRNHLENEPFPVLVNTICSEFGNAKIYFRHNLRDNNNAFIKDENGENYTTDTFFIYCRRYNIRPFVQMEEGLRTVYINKIKENEENVQALCHEAENCIIELFIQHNLDPDIVKAYFGLNKKIDTKGHDLTDYSSLYKLLTNKKSGLFAEELHHDRSRCNTDMHPNSNIENFILTLIPVSFEKICEVINNKISNEILFDQKNAQCKLARQALQNISQNSIAHYFDIHNQILHGADIEIHYNNKKGEHFVRTYFNTPKREDDNKADYVVAAVRAGAEIRNREKSQFYSVSSHQVVVAMKKFGSRFYG